MVDVGSVRYQVELDNSGLDRDVKTTESTITQKLDAIGGKLSRQFGYTLLKDIGSAFISAGKAAAGFAQESINVGREFDASMAQVAATMGTTVDQIGELRDFAQEMGASTAFSATQAAEALNYMALAGYDAETSMAMLPNVLNLAAAGGIELAAASDMITDAQTALGLSLEETTMMVDQMAKTSSISNTSVAQLGEAMLTIGANARDVAGGTTELSTMLGVLADNGIKGAEAGTHLRNVILAMNPTTDKAKDAWEALGVSAYDADGKLRALPNIFQDLNSAMEGMDMRTKQQLLSDMFNKTDLASVNALLGTSAERFEELATEIDGAWFTFSALDDELKTKGLPSLDAMRASFTELGVSAEDFDAILKYSQGDADLFADMLTDAADVGVTFDDVAQALGGDLEALSLAFEDTTGAAQAMADTQLDNLEGDITLMKSALEGVQIALSDQLTPVLRRFAQEGSKQLSGLTTAIREDGLAGALQFAQNLLQETVDSLIAQAPEMLEAGVELITSFMDSVTEKLPEIQKKGMELVSSIATGIANNLPEILTSAGKLLYTLATGLVDSIPQLVDAAGKIIMSLAGFLIDNGPQIVAKGAELIEKLIEGLIQAIPKIGEGVGQVIDAIKDKFGEFDWGEIGRNIIDGLKNGITGAASRAGDAITETGGKIVDWGKKKLGIESPSKVFRDEVGKMIPLGMAEGIDAGAEDVNRSMESLTQDLISRFTADVTYDLPDLSSYTEQLGASLTGTAQTEITVPLIVDGREMARATAWYTNEQLAWEAR